MAGATILLGAIEKVTREEMVLSIKAMKSEGAAGPSKLDAEIISSSGEELISVMMVLCQHVLDGDGMRMNGRVPIFKSKEDVKSYNAYREVKLLEHAMKIVNRVLEKRI